MGRALHFVFRPPCLTISGPLADGWLSRADRWLGFDWLAYYQFSRPYFDVLRVAYQSFLWLPAALVILGLAIEHQHSRVWQFVTAAMFALVIAIAIFPFAPAASPNCNLSGYRPGTRRGRQVVRPIMTALRDGSVRTIELHHIAGMVSFPSYHTVAAVQLAWAAWSSRWLRWPVALVCGGMALAIPTFGDHYLIDMVGGAILAIAAILIAKRLIGPSRAALDASSSCAAGRHCATGSRLSILSSEQLERCRVLLVQQG